MGGFYPGDKYYNALFENPGFGNHWISVKLVGVRSNRSAIGTRIRVEVETGAARRSIYRSVTSGGSFGANPLSQLIGLGKCERITALEIHWPTSGTVQHFGDVRLDTAFSITEGSDELGTAPADDGK